MEKISRRLVNLIVQNSIGCRPAFSLYRINPWRFFYPTTTQALDAAASAGAATANNKIASIENARLPRAAISFYRPCPPDGSGDINFMSLGGSSNDIISMDQDGNTLLYEAASRAVRVMPVPHEPKLSPVSVAIDDSLYLLNENSGLQDYVHPFEAFHYKNSSGLCGDDKWYWCSLPPPPFVIDYYDGCQEVEDDNTCSSYHQNKLRKSPYVIEAYTVVGDLQIWVSTEVGVTYSFNTTSGVWSNAGKWPLPFSGSVKYAPEHGLWFGFSSQGWQFAASDLGAASTMTPPVLHKAWNEPLPKQWVQVMAPYLLPLGSGKFCIGRVFDLAEPAEEGWCQEGSNRYRTEESFAVFTGVEVDRRGSRGALRLIKHKSKRFSLGRRMVETIL